MFLCPLDQCEFWSHHLKKFLSDLNGLELDFEQMGRGLTFLEVEVWCEGYNVEWSLKNKVLSGFMTKNPPIQRYPAAGQTRSHPRMRASNGSGHEGVPDCNLTRTCTLKFRLCCMGIQIPALPAEMVGTTSPPLVSAVQSMHAMAGPPTSVTLVGTRASQNVPA